MPTAELQAADTTRALAAIVEASDDAIVGKTLEGIVTNWNPAAERLYGWTAAEMVGQPITRIVPPERITELPAIFEQLRHGERVDHFETVRVTKDGRRLDVSVSIAPIPDASGAIVGAAAITRDITARKRSELNQRFLAEASHLLGSSLNIESTLAAVARLAVPTLADWCVVDVVEEGSHLRRVAVAHVDPGKVALAEDLQRRYPPDPAARAGPAQVLRTGQPELVAEITDEMLVAGARDAEHLALLRRVGLRSYLTVPLAAHGKLVGTISFVDAESGRRFGPEHLALAEVLAERAALAIDNARLYQAASATETRYRSLVEGVADAILVADADRRYLDVNRAAEVLLGYDRHELLGLRMDDVVVGEPDRAVAEFTRFLAEGHWQGELEARRKDGSTVPVEVRGTVVDLPDGPVYLSAVRDITERVAAYALLERRLHGLSAVARSLTVSPTLETTLTSLAAEVVRVTPAIACSVKLIDEEQGRIQTIATCGLPSGYAEAIEAAFQAGANLASIEAYRTRRPVLRSIQRDVLPDPLHAPLYRFLGDIAGDTILCVPVVYRDRVLGTLSCSYPLGQEPDAAEIAYFPTIADQVAVAVENARLFTEAQGKAALEERQRLARELHDSVSQSIYGLTLYTEAASRLLANGEIASVSTYLGEISGIAREALQEMRVLIFELRPPVLDQEGLVAALRARLDAVESRAGLETALEADGIGRLPADIEHALYRIAQEALTNALRHARARSVSVAVRRLQGTITLTITDDGAGFDPTATGSRGGFGLSGMTERAEQVGARLRVDSTPGVGTRVQVEMVG